MSKLGDFLNESQYNTLGDIVYKLEQDNPIYFGKRINNNHLKWIGDISLQLQNLRNDLFLIRQEIKGRQND